MAVRNSLLEKFLGKFLDAAGKLKFLADFPAARNAIPAKVWARFPARKTAAGKLAAPSGTLLDFLLRDRHSLLEFFRLELVSL